MEICIPHKVWRGVVTGLKIYNPVIVFSKKWSISSTSVLSTTPNHMCTPSKTFPPELPSSLDCLSLEPPSPVIWEGFVSLPGDCSLGEVTGAMPLESILLASSQLGIRCQSPRMDKHAVSPCSG